VSSKTSNHSATINRKAPLKALSFFPGYMSLDLGLEQEGVEILLACEIDPAARKIIEVNRPDIVLIEDIKKYSAVKLREKAELSPSEEIDMIVCSLPDRPFNKIDNDERDNLFLMVVDLIIELQPKFVVIETHKGILAIEYLLSPIINKLEVTGYGVSFKWYNYTDFGSSQQQTRVITICNRDGKKPPYLTPTHANNVMCEPSEWRTRDRYRQVGDDTPSPLGRAIAKMLLTYLEQEGSISYPKKIEKTFDSIKTIEEWEREVDSSNTLSGYEKYFQIAAHKYLTLNGIENEIEVTCDGGRIDVIVSSMNMIIEFKAIFNKDNLEKGVAQLNRYARSTGMSRKVLIGLSPESESKKIGIVEEIKRLESINVNLEVHMFDPQTQKFDLYKILQLDREDCSDFEKNIIKKTQNLIEWLSVHLPAIIARILNDAGNCVAGRVYLVGGLLKPSSQGQLNPSY
jgi:C-5 cytosine-specific DNA methylase/PD-(D/E)XK nuclease superfamily